MANFLLVLLLVLSSPLALFANSEEDFNYTYYPTLDYDSAYELHVIKRNYYRYGNKLKILADKRIKEIKQAGLNKTNEND